MFLWRLPACKVALQPTKSGSQPEVNQTLDIIAAGRKPGISLPRFVALRLAQFGQERPLTPLSFDFGDW